MTTLEALLQVQALIGDPEHPERWTKGAYARDKFGKPRSLSGEGVCSWSIRAAIKALHGVNWLVVHDQLVAQCPVDSQNPIVSLVVFNDAPSTTHADICDLIQRAIDAERAKEVAQ